MDKVREGTFVHVNLRNFAQLGHNLLHQCRDLQRIEMQEFVRLIFQHGRHAVEQLELLGGQFVQPSLQQCKAVVF